MATEPNPRFTKNQLNVFRKKLDETRKNLLITESDLEKEGLRDLSEDRTGEISHVRTHLADLGSDEMQRDIVLGVAESEIQEVQDIENALSKIENQTYGFCEECGIAIPFARLEALPYTRHCGPCEMKLEKQRKDHAHRSQLT
jgi:DnaK suppressor protein